MESSTSHLTQDCAFCTIIRGEDAAVQILWRELDWLAFFPDAPATRGHTLVVPTVHVEDYWTASEDVVASLAAACLRVGQALQAVVDPGGMNLITSRGSAAEQTIPHLHFHLVPRWEADAIGPIWPPKELPDLDAMSRLAVEVRETMRAA